MFSKCSFALILNDAMELVRMSELMVMFRADSFPPASELLSVPFTDSVVAALLLPDFEEGDAVEAGVPAPGFCGEIAATVVGEVVEVIKYCCCCVFGGEFGARDWWPRD